MALPCQVEDLTDSPEFRARATGIMRRNTLAIVDNVTELSELGLVADVSAEAWVHRAAPLFKLYLINNEEVFFGFYPVREHIISLGGEPRAIYDVMGKDAILFHHSTTDDDTSTGDEKNLRTIRDCSPRRGRPHLVRGEHAPNQSAIERSLELGEVPAQQSRRWFDPNIVHSRIACSAAP